MLPLIFDSTVLSNKLLLYEFKVFSFVISNNVV